MHANSRAHAVAKWIAALNFFGVISCNFFFFWPRNSVLPILVLNQDVIILREEKVWERLHRSLEKSRRGSTIEI